nr:hypothetical protein [Actinomycetota bacterium]
AVALQPGPLGVLRATGLTRALAAFSGPRSLGTVVALVGPSDLAPGATADLGRHLLRLWLSAGRLGLACHPLSQLLDCAESAGLLGSELGAGRAAYAMFRLGAPLVRPARSARLTD